MSWGVIGSICFYIDLELNVAVYPHDDTGFGCVGLNEQKSAGIEFLKLCENNRDFKVLISDLMYTRPIR